MLSYGSMFLFSISLIKRSDIFIYFPMKMGCFLYHVGDSLMKRKRVPVGECTPDYKFEFKSTKYFNSLIKQDYKKWVKLLQCNHFCLHEHMKIKLKKTINKIKMIWPFECWHCANQIKEKTSISSYVNVQNYLIGLKCIPI